MAFEDLDTVGGYVAQARSLLQDTETPQRYADADIKFAISAGLNEAYRARPDLFRGTGVPFVLSTSPDATAVAIDPMYRIGLLNYVVGHMKMRDEEEAGDTGVAWKASFIQKLVTLSP